ncbi:uncharacterized protein EV420DRAFT_1475885 [Desarmillaria tabescens]|uniref:Hemerythrin-like domain-containing protein n=1 Tax=Armillaria tabescens TaxID=1929756 RepID=A0AA39TMR3_ARMTA|nr:uncharacterized protein EV420DRAFT_1475885 [Desarmillaria tabescens]KAK0464412.1 hypothetical protein EV420DRAFT_1475885 [Desarmillaria tabescens]
MATDQAQRTLTAAIKEDHEEPAEIQDAQARWSRQLTWEIARHAVGEEIVVYPLMEKHLGEKGLELADEDRNDHQRVKEMLSDLENMEPGSQDHQTQPKQIMDHLHQHNDNEERKDLPLLEPVLGVEKSTKTANSFRTTKKFVPTPSFISSSAHPSAPNKPPYETFLGFLTMPIDKLKDMRLKEQEKEQE